MSFRLSHLRVVLPLLGGAAFVLGACGGDDAPSAPPTSTGGAAGAKAGGSAGSTTAGSAGTTGGLAGKGGSSGAAAGGAAGTSAAGNAGAAGGGTKKPGASCAQDGECGLVGIETQPASCAEAYCNAGVCALRALDTDGDGFRKKLCKLVSDGAFAIELGGDCDDTNKDVNPKGWDGPAGDGKPNGCGDGVDQDCSGLDGDAVTTTGASCSCVPGDVEGCGQTDGGVAITFPGGAPAPGSICTLGSRTCLKDATTGGGKWGPCTGAQGPVAEVCNNKDDDCDGQTDEDDAQGKLEWVYDGDADGYRATKADGSTFATRSACSKPLGTPPECDAAYCGVGVDLATCCPPDRWRLGNTASNNDCDDRDSKVNPAAPEICADATKDKDDNCNGTKDELPAVGSELWFFDGDDDDYGDKAVTPKASCAAPGVGWKKGIPNTDCDDAVKTTNPGVAENCATPQDDNCNNTAKDTCGCLVGTDPPVDCGTVNDCVYIPGGSTCVAGVYSACPAPIPKQPYCPDGDKDGSCNRAACVDACPSGTATAASTATRQPDGFVARAECPLVSDCDDANDKRTPGKTELCGSYDNNIDTDCDGAPDNGFSLGATCNVTDLAIGACKDGGTRTCSGPQSVTCTSPAALPPPAPYEPSVPAATYHTNPAPNGSFDWNCDNSSSRIQGFASLNGGNVTTPYCIQTVPLPGVIQGTPAEPAPWTDKTCLHPTPDGTFYKLPTCANFTQQSTCGTYNYFTSCKDVASSGTTFNDSFFTCKQPCGQPISRLACKWDAPSGKCVGATLLAGTYYVGCY